jgi:SWI/SNF-related matrix-associated actin-dependent regulator of chromatin subfamily A3
MSQIAIKLNSGHTPQFAGHYVFGIGRSSNEVFLKFPDGTEFAALNNHMTKVVGSIIDLPCVQLEAVANLATLRETIARATKASDATLRVNINVYGSRETRNDVACHLSAGKIYLQHPDQQRPGSTYDNPHLLELPGMRIQATDFKLPQIGSESVLLGDDAKVFGQAVSDVYASLKRGSHLKRLVGDSRLRTSLLP